LLLLGVAGHRGCSAGRAALERLAYLAGRRTSELISSLLAPYVAAEAVHDLVSNHHPETTRLGIALTAVALLEMPILGRTKQRLGERLSSSATKGEGRQNYICGAQAAAVLAGLVVTAITSGGWWLDPIVAIGIAGWAVYEGFAAWHGEPCSC
jgi:divalent metal cation (Fe/Co/Zn/Cd) transporter